MTTAHAHDRTDATSRAGRAAGAVVLVADAQHGELRVRRLRAFGRAVTRLRGFSLDARIAAGTAPETSWLLAARARTLVSPQEREQLARNWAHLASRAAAPAQPGPRAPVCRSHVLAAWREISELQQALRAPGPAQARGVAMARHLLEDATSPVYSRRTEASLAASLRDAICHLDPGLWP
jgi:hypothetical protein